MEQYSLSVNVENAGNARLHLGAVDKTSVLIYASPSRFCPRHEERWHRIRL